MTFDDWWKIWEAMRYGIAFECLECTAVEAKRAVELFEKLLGTQKESDGEETKE